MGPVEIQHAPSRRDDVGRIPRTRSGPDPSALDKWSNASVRTCQSAVGALSPTAAWIEQQRLPAEQGLDRLGFHLVNPTSKEKQA